MPQITYTIRYRKNTGIVMSAMEMDALYFYGSNFYSKDGTILSNEVRRTYILSAQREIEKFLNIKLALQLHEETQSYYKDDYYQQFPIIKTMYNVNTPLALVGLVGKIEQIIYPKEWLYSHYDSDGLYSKRISVVPNGGASYYVQSSGDVILTGLTSQIGLQRYQNIPDYWRIQYVTGFSYKNIPEDLINVVGKLGSIGVFAMYGDIILGAGIANMSISIDGLSQSIGTTSSPTNAGFGARILQYQKEVKETLKRLKGFYKGFNYTVL